MRGGRCTQPDPGGTRLLAAVIAALAIVATSRADAHVVFERRSLRQWAQADVVVVAEIRSGLTVWRAADGSDVQEYVSIRILHALRGQPGATELDVFPHAEGEPRWRPGDRAVLFLDRTAERMEFAPLSSRFPYYTVQGAGAEWILEPETEADFLEVVRAWVAAPTETAAIRNLLLRQIRSGDKRLHSDAVAELVRGRSTLLRNAADVAPFAQILRTGQLVLLPRIALAQALDGAPGFDAGATLLSFAAGNLTSADRTALIRAAGMSQSSGLEVWLTDQLRDADPLVRRQAATALGHPWHADRVPFLTAVAKGDEEVVALAAVRALAAIGSRPAWAALAELSVSERPSIARAARALNRFPADS